MKVLVKRKIFGDGDKTRDGDVLGTAFGHSEGIKYGGPVRHEKSVTLLLYSP